MKITRAGSQPSSKGSSAYFTGADRVARQRFDFELADPGHLDAILRSVRAIDSVYDSFRVLPQRQSQS